MEAADIEFKGAKQAPSLTFGKLETGALPSALCKSIDGSARSSAIVFLFLPNFEREVTPSKVSGSRRDAQRCVKIIVRRLPKCYLFVSSLEMQRTSRRFANKSANCTLSDKQ